MVEGFARALGVELVAERGEAPLLRAERGCGRPGGFPFQRLVHALVVSVLLGMRGLDQLGRMPSRIHQADSCERRPRVQVVL